MVHAAPHSTEGRVDWNNAGAVLMAEVPRDRFTELLKRLVRVPKSEIEEKEREHDEREHESPARPREIVPLTRQKGT